MGKLTAAATRHRLQVCLGSVMLGASIAAGAVEHATPTAPLQLALPARPVKADSDVYVIQLREPPVLNYRGGRAGFAATRPADGGKIQSRSGAVESYARYLEDSHDRMLATAGAVPMKIHSYRYALNGFAARLTAQQVSALQRSGEVARIWLDSEQHVQTNNSAIFLGLEDQNGGLRADLKLRGESIVVAVIDSGVAPGHPSLKDTEEQIPERCNSQWAEASWLGIFLCNAVRRHPPIEVLFDPPAGFQGDCQSGEGFEAADCNNKLIGARYYIDGFLARNELDPGEFVSPRDADGHGTHIATTIAGNAVTADLFGTRVGRIAGIAPRARVAVYKACWLKPGAVRASCSTADLVRAIDDAVADAADIINYSVGNLEAGLDAPDDIALLNAFDAGVFSVVAAGNDGPGSGTIGSPAGAPWVLTVGASTQSGNRFDEAVTITSPDRLSQRIEIREASFTPQLKDREPLEEELVLIDDGRSELADGLPGSIRDGCEALTNADDISGHIALLQRGGCTFQVKLERVADAGALAAVVYSDSGAPIIMNGDAGSVDIPAVMISTADGQRLVDEILAETVVEVELAKGVFLTRNDRGSVMGDFSSRGPTLSEPDFIKPDITAPGVKIFAGHTPVVANGLEGEFYQYLSGTSMSAPEVAGVAALLKEASPDWTPAQLKSALTTSARGGVLKEDGLTVATPFDAGAGHIDANRAIDPGLAYDSSYLEHAAYVCGFDPSPFQAADCAILAAAGFSSAARDLNLPSIGIGQLVSGDAVTRRVTNLGPPATYALDLEEPPGIEIVVEPTSLTLDTGQTAEFNVRFQRGSASLDSWSFGRLRWTDGTRHPASVVAVRPVTLRAPAELGFSGSTGGADIPVAFGYGGPYQAQVHGLRAALTDFCRDQDDNGVPCEIQDDPTNSFSFREDGGVNAHLIEVPPGQLYARFSLFDEFTDGNDDLDLYLFYCPDSQCTQIAQSGSFTSREEINLTLPEAGIYAALVHGFETDDVSGGPGAGYTLFAWSFGAVDDAGNLRASYPATVSDGDRAPLAIDWGPLAPATRYLGAVSHVTPAGRYAMTLLRVDSP
jgi:subtilisin family serine protease